jgi:NADH-quinone oxidoreductase subunit J
MNGVPLFFIIISLLISYYIIFSRKIIYSVLSLFLIFIFIGILYLLMGSAFLFISQILIYAGGIIVLIIFAIYTVGIKETEGINLKEGFIAFVLNFLIFFLIAKILKDYPFPKKIISFKMDFVFDKLLKDYLIAFEIVGLLIVISIIGTFLSVKEK